MREFEVDLITPDGAMNTFVAHPEGTGRFPVVLFLMDAPGKRPELHDMARRLASNGYFVMLPNLYYRCVREFDASQDLTGRENEIRALVATLDFDTVAADISVLLRHAEAITVADAASVGVVGYCMSGPFAYAAAAMFPTRVSAAASIHGVRLHGEGSPEQLADDVVGELYFACAELDEFVPPRMVDALEHHLNRLGVRATIERYHGARHGFVFPSRRGAFDEAACERHFERLVDLFARNLGA